MAGLAAEPGRTLPSWYQEIIASPPSSVRTSHRCSKQLSNNSGRRESHRSLILVAAVWEALDRLPLV